MKMFSIDINQEPALPHDPVFVPEEITVQNFLHLKENKYANSKLADILDLMIGLLIDDYKKYPDMDTYTIKDRILLHNNLIIMIRNKGTEFGININEIENFIISFALKYRKNPYRGYLKLSRY